jgi:hypothetical protein
MDTQAVGKAGARSIERRHRLPYAEFEHAYLRRRRPVVLTGCMDDWPALAKWTPEFLRQKYGSVPVTVEGRTQPLGEFLDRVLASTPEQPAPYLKDAMVRRLSPELMRDIEPFVEYSFPNWLQGLYPSRPFHYLMNAAQVELFVGGWGTRLGQLHFDYIHTHTVLCQVFGRKEFTLFAPEDTPWLYATDNQSAITNVDEVDLERYPLFPRATPVRFVQEPGEIVFLPSAWWHTTRLLTASIAVGVNFANASNWADVTRDACDQLAARRPLRRAFVRAFLALHGCLKQLQGRWAGAKKLGIAPRRSPPV